MSFLGFPPASNTKFTFTAPLLESLAAWNDANGYWVGYNTTLAAMYEAIYEIAADQGSADVEAIGVLAAPLGTGSAITSLPILAAPASAEAGTLINLVDPTSGTAQLWSATAAIHIGATSIAVASLTPNFAYPAGSQLSAVYVPGFSTLLDPYNCPAADNHPELFTPGSPQQTGFLPFLGQFNGTAIQTGMDPAQARLKIIHECAQNRGTLSSITYAAQRNLTGTKFVQILERTDPVRANPYWFLLIIQVPQLVSAAALIDAVNLVKPGGVMWSLIGVGQGTLTNWIIAQLEKSYASIAQMEASASSIAILEIGGGVQKAEATTTAESVHVTRVP